MGRFLNRKFQIYFLFNGVLTHNLTLKDQQNSTKAHFSDQNLPFSSTVLGNDGYIFFLDASTQLFNKLMIITSNNMIKMGGVIQGEITRLELRIRGVINYF